MSTPTPSFRFPFTLPEDTHPQVAAAIRYSFNGLADLNQAIAALTPQVKAHGASITTITNNIAAAAASGGGTPATVFGNVNLQPDLTPGAYTTQSSDFGDLILVESGIPFTLTLNSGLVTPFYASIYNLGTGVVTLVPTTGLVNLVASVTLGENQSAVIYFDGVNWYAVSPVLAETIAKGPSEWLDSYSAVTGVFTQSQPAASDLSNGTTGSGKVVLDSGGTLVNTTFTGITAILNLGIYANNAAAIVGGLVAGDLYRVGSDPDLVAIVH